MSKVIVFELKRLVPFLLLLILLAGLSFYDYMTPQVRETGVIKDEQKDDQVLEVEERADLNFTTKEQGYRTESPAFQVAVTDQEWQDISSQYNLGLSADYFDENEEVGLFAFNSEVSELRKLNSESKEEIDNTTGVDTLEVKINPVQGFYHVVVVDKSDLGTDEMVNWHFVDQEGNLLHEFEQNND